MENTFLLFLIYAREYNYVYQDGLETFLSHKSCNGAIFEFQCDNNRITLFLQYAFYFTLTMQMLLKQTKLIFK